MTTEKHHKMYRRKNQGFSLIEVLVALLVLAIGLLGLAALQATGMRYSGNASLRTQVIILSQDMIERMRANPTAVAASPAGSDNTNYKITSTLTAATPNCSSGCSSTDMATYDVKNWQINLASLLPEGTGTIVVTDEGSSIYKVETTINWRERQTEGATTATATARTFTLETRL